MESPKNIEILSEVTAENYSPENHDENQNIEEVVNCNSENVELRRSSRIRNPPEFYGERANICIQPFDEPATVKSAMAGADSLKWKDAMSKEIDSMYKNKVWDLVEKPINRNLISSKWIFKKKIGADGEVSTYKARLVAQGYSQKEGVDYDEIFSPVVRFETVRTILALSSKYKFVLHQMDVSSAFLNGDLQEELYMAQPEGFIASGEEHLVCKLKKSIYELKQAPRCWNSCLDIFFKSLDFQKSTTDSCIYTKYQNGSMSIVSVYVDDIIIACESENNLLEIKSSLCSRFEMKDLGLLNYFLGVNIVQNSDFFFIHQSNFIKSLLEKFGFENSKPISTPVDVSISLEKAGDDFAPCDVEKYQSAVGALLYLSMRTRPDITFAVCNVAKFASKPTLSHWLAVKRIFRYLKGTTNFGIMYNRHNGSDDCIGYSDADWAGDNNDRKSTSGYCFCADNKQVS